MCGEQECGEVHDLNMHDVTVFGTLTVITGVKLCPISGVNVKELKWKPHQVMTLADTWDLVWSTTVR